MRPQTEAKLATFFAKPEWPEIRKLLCSMGHGSAVKDIDAIVRKVRVRQWGDHSSPSPQGSFSEPSDA